MDKIKPFNVSFYFASDLDLHELDIDWSFTFGDTDYVLVRASEVFSEIQVAGKKVPPLLTKVMTENPKVLISF